MSLRLYNNKKITQIILYNFKHLTFNTFLIMKTKLRYLLIALFFGVAAMNAQNIWLTGTGFGGWDEAGRIQLETTDNVTYTKSNIEIVGDRQFKFTEGTWATAAGFNAALSDPNGFPNGVAAVVDGSPNMIGVLGFWNVTYNHTTKAYSFTPGVNPNRIVVLNGGGLSPDENLPTTDGINYSKESVVFATGGNTRFLEAASAINPTPTANWSAVDFPAGVGVQDGTLIPVPAGVYYVFFNINTGDYAFDPTVVSMIGGMNGWNDGSGAWDMLTTDGVTYYLNNVTFAAGGDFKFRDNHSWNNNFGASAVNDFPSGTAAPDCCEVSNIHYAAGTYNVTFNRVTLAYEFVSLNANVDFNSSNATPSNIHLATTDGVNYTGNGVEFGAGGAGSFDEIASLVNPAGPFGTWPVATTPVNARRNIAFDKTTGVYSFPFVTYGITGGMNGWGGNDDLSTTDGYLYTLNNYVLAAPADFKIREGHSWSYKNYGSVDPAPVMSGAIVHEGNNFHLEAGTWNISLDISTMTFSFTNALAVNKFDANKFSVYPNPSNSSWNFASASGDITSVRIVDLLGKTVLTKKASSSEVSVDASSLANGMYFAEISSGDAVQTVKVVKN